MAPPDPAAHRLDPDDPHESLYRPRADKKHSPDDDRPTDRGRQIEEHRTIVKPAKTSAAAVFSLVFGLSALLSVLTVLLAPLAIVLAVIGIVLGVIGLRMARRTGVTGKGVAIGGLTLAVIALLLALTALIGISTFLNDDAAVNRLEKQVQQLRDDLPTDVTVPTP